MEPMKQQSLGLGQSNKRTRRREFLSEMERVVPWSALVELVAPYMPEGRRGRPPFAVEAMLRIHFMQQWFNLSDPAMEDALHDVPLFREFAGLGGWDDRLLDESTILRFRPAETYRYAGAGTRCRPPMPCNPHCWPWTTSARFNRPGRCSTPLVARCRRFRATASGSTTWRR